VRVNRQPTALVANVPGSSPTLQALVRRALTQARNSFLENGTWPNWSAAFVNACVREAERNLDLEGPFGAREILLALSPNGRHWEYVREAHRRRFGCRRADGTLDATCKRDGTYHAFEPRERPVQPGDIIVRDRRANRTDSPSNTWRFEESQANQGDMHADIVVEVDRSGSPPFAETVGGNVDDTARRVRIPLDGDGKLVVDRSQNIVVQKDDGTFDALPSAGSAGGDLDPTSTRRIFAVLSPVEQCTVPPPQASATA